MITNYDDQFFLIGGNQFEQALKDMYQSIAQNGISWSLIDLDGGVTDRLCGERLFLN